MFYTGLDPYTMKEVYVAKDPHEKAMQRALIQYKDPANYELVKEALIKAHREDLIGTGAECLIRPNGGRRKTPGITAGTANGIRKTAGERNTEQIKQNE
jgi:hypothetical protein